MSQFIKIKDSLIADLWIPTIKRAGSMFYPRLKKNKQMKLLTLTSDENFKEIDSIISEKISEKSITYPWNYDRLKKIRLESEGLDNVLGATKYEDSIMSTTHDIQNYFPFDIINLDFYSQDPITQSGRFEKEIMGLDQTLSLQSSKGSNKLGFVLIFTSIINGLAINCNDIIENSGKIKVDGWTSLSISENGIIVDFKKKILVVESVSKQLALKYGYKLEMDKKEHNIVVNEKSVYSLACIFKRDD